MVGGLFSLSLYTMKIIIQIPEKNLKLEFENFTYSQFRMFGAKPSEHIPGMAVKYPIGEPLTIITSNIPIDLQSEINELIESYCNI